MTNPFHKEKAKIDLLKWKIENPPKETAKQKGKRFVYKYR